MFKKSEQSFMKTPDLLSYIIWSVWTCIKFCNSSPLTLKFQVWTRFVRAHVHNVCLWRICLWMAILDVCCMVNTLISLKDKPVHTSVMRPHWRCSLDIFFPLVYILSLDIDCTSILFQLVIDILGLLHCSHWRISWLLRYWLVCRVQSKKLGRMSGSSG
jgi:hypothetical protein